MDSQAQEEEDEFEEEAQAARSGRRTTKARVGLPRRPGGKDHTRHSLGGLLRNNWENIIGNLVSIFKTRGKNSKNGIK